MIHDLRLAIFVADRVTGSSRLRALQYVPMLEADGVRVRVCATRPSTYLTRPARLRAGSLAHRAFQVAGISLIVLQRLWQIAVVVPRSDVVLLQKRLLFRSRTGALELLLLRVARLRGVRVVFDVDDAIHLGTSTGRRRGLRRTVMAIASRSDLVVAGSSSLAKDFLSCTEAVQIVPTCLAPLPTEPEPKAFDGTARLLWTGSPANAVHLELVLDVLTDLARTTPLGLEIVTRLADLPDVPFEGLDVRLTEYSPEAEMAALHRSDIGLAPLEPSPWTEAKCGGRILAYFAAGLPVVASPVGAQARMVQHGGTGLHATTRDEWAAALRLLIDDPDLRHRLGEAGHLHLRRALQPEAWYPKWRDWVMGL